MSAFKISSLQAQGPCAQYKYVTWLSPEQLSWMPKAGLMELSWGWWLVGLAPPLKTLEVSIDVAHPDDGPGGMVFPTAPWKALGSLNPSMQVGQGLMPPECCWTRPTVLTATFGWWWGLCVTLLKQGLTTVCISTTRLGLTSVD